MGVCHRRCARGHLCACSYATVFRGNVGGLLCFRFNSIEAVGFSRSFVGNLRRDFFSCSNDQAGSSAQLASAFAKDATAKSTTSAFHPILGCSRVAERSPEADGQLPLFPSRKRTGSFQPQGGHSGFDRAISKPDIAVGSQL